MREALDLNLTDLSRFTMLVHGGYGVGKTYLVGDFLKTVSSEGAVRFLNVKGEDGYLSLASLGLGAVGETVTTYKEFEEAIKDYAKEKLVGLAVDSLKPLSDLVFESMLGEARLPDAKRDGERAKAYWAQQRFAMEQMAATLRRTAQYVLCVCPSDRSSEELSGRVMITPNLIGKAAVGSAGWFDFVGYLSADVVAPGKVRRVFDMTPRADVVTRQRLPRPILRAIELPEGEGGWKRIREAIDNAMGKA